MPVDPETPSEDVAADSAHTSRPAAASVDAARLKEVFLLAAEASVAERPGLLARLGFAFDFLRITGLSSRAGSSRRVVFYDISGRRQRLPEDFRDDLSTLFGLLEAGRITPRVQRVFSMEEAVEAHRLIEAGQVEGRLVLDLTLPSGGDASGHHAGSDA